MEKFLIFLEMEFSYVLRSRNPPKKILMFQETELFYIPGDGNLNV